MVSKLPGISCYCATYGRPKKLIENSIQCFLDQDWTGPKELIIFNDCKHQKFFYDHPEIKIVNIDDKIPYLGAKFNETIKLCQYDYLATWEDDDTFLKHRLTYSFNHLQHNNIFHTKHAFVERKYQILIKKIALFHSAHLIHKNLFFDIGGYDEVDIRTIDLKFMSKIKNKIGNYSQNISDDKIFYIYNWLTNSYHGSHPEFKPHNISSMVEAKIAKLIKEGKIECGHIYLKPKLRYNYYDYLPHNK